MIPKCLTCEFYYQEECPDCHDDSQWREDALIRDVRKEERERCADACIQIASELAKAANLASKDKVLAKSQADMLFAESCIAIDCARKIRGES